MKQTHLNRPDLIIQAGIAGCFTRRMPGEVFIVEEEEMADLGVWEEKRFKTIFDLRLTDKEALPFTGGRLLNPYTGLMKFCGLERVKGVTVNEITTDPARVEWYQQNGPAVVESMEGAALHYVCLQENIPFLQMRSISNAVGERDKTKWEIQTALRQLNEQLIRLLKNLEQDNPDLLKKYK
jgi:futalosine hydrolase